MSTFLRTTSAPNGKERVYFDLDSTACPFKLRWMLTQPVLPNKVDEIGEPNPGRAEFIAWLAERKMNLDAGALRTLFGEGMRIQVPCGKLDLNAPAVSS